jgi:alkanesulfonate monooxygenase SsuD/methylene tetrahydromethanopterin reductase-like flavin-dependent oxidoreductase (luciferase family)
MALVTQNLSFGVTVNLSYEQPYQFARRFASLDHLTQGRLGWNIVTGYLDSAERLIGQKGLKDHDARYDQAEEFLQLCYQYWEGSWENDALKKISNSAFLLIPIKSTRSIIKGNITKAKVCFRLRLRFNVPQHSSKQVLHRKDYSLPRVMPNVFLLVVISLKRFVSKLIKYDYKHTTRS